MRRLDWTRAWPLAAAIALVYLARLPYYAPVYTVILLTSVLMYVVLTGSWALFSAPTGYTSLAVAAFFGVGMYTCAILGKRLPLPVVVIVGGLASAGLALVVGALTLRLRGIYFSIFTFGLVELIKHVLLWYEIKYTGTRGRFVVLSNDRTIYQIMLSVFVILLVTGYAIRRSKYGLALRCIGAQEDAAAHTGVNVDALKIVTFAVSAIFAGAAGAVMATKWTYIDPYIAFNPFYSFVPALMATFGGSGHFLGPEVGAVILGYLEELLLTRFPYYYMLILGVTLVAAILYLPEGLVGLAQMVWRRILGEKRVDA